MVLHNSHRYIDSIRQRQKTKFALNGLAIMKQIVSYFIQVFKPNGPHKTNNFNLKVMHGINKISILMFLFCLLVMLYRALR